MPGVDAHFSGRSPHVLETSIHLNRRVHKTEQMSANRWHFDEQFLRWLLASYELAQ
ncbi:MAG TPA: hypothetical protein VGQ46_19845 [Thermoanaerobaculia bacterium]|nr:hypothetical protein [Thermoanaerobaculia bacterium]